MRTVSFFSLLFWCFSAHLVWLCADNLRLRSPLSASTSRREGNYGSAPELTPALTLTGQSFTQCRPMAVYCFLSSPRSCRALLDASSLLDWCSVVTVHSANPGAGEEIGRLTGKRFYCAKRETKSPSANPLVWSIPKTKGRLQMESGRVRTFKEPRELLPPRR